MGQQYVKVFLYILHVILPWTLYYMQRILELEADSAKTHRDEGERMVLAIMPLFQSLDSVRSRPHFSAVYFLL